MLRYTHPLTVQMTDKIRGPEVGKEKKSQCKILSYDSEAAALSAEKCAKDRYRKRLERRLRSEYRMNSSGRTGLEAGPSSETPRSKTKKLLKNSTVSPNVRKALVFHHALVGEISNSARKLKNERQRRLAAKLVQGAILRRSRVCGLAKRSGIPVLKKNLPPGKEMDFDDNSRSKRSDKVDQDTTSLIKEFFTRDDNSRLTSGKKDTVTKNKVRMQKRLLTDTIENLHEKFLSEKPQNAVSYTVFTRLRPFWVRIAQAKDRQTCLCRIHDNIQLKADKLFSVEGNKYHTC